MFQTIDLFIDTLNFLAAIQYAAMCRVLERSNNGTTT